MWSYFYWKMPWEYHRGQEVKHFSFIFLFQGTFGSLGPSWGKGLCSHKGKDFTNWITNTTPLQGFYHSTWSEFRPLLSMKSDPIKVQGNFASGRICKTAGIIYLSPISYQMPLFFLFQGNFLIFSINMMWNFECEWVYFQMSVFYFYYT